MILSTIVLFLLSVAAAFFAFRDILPGRLQLLMQLVFALLVIAFLVCVNILALRGSRRRKGESPPDTTSAE